MKNLTILLDMDEVLVDFVSGACQAHGITKDQLHAVQEPGVWNSALPLGRIIGSEVSPSDFWKPIHDQGERFWDELGPLPWIDKIIEMVSKITDEWHIASAPARHEGCYSGKVKWLKRKFGPTFDQFCLTPHKHLFAKEGVLLIDDREENITKFIAAGGQGLIFPTIGNSLHEYRNDPVAHLAMSLETLLGE